MSPEVVRQSFIKHAVPDGVNLIEGNRGLHDGMDVEGSHSSAALSKLIECPVILVQNVTKTTRNAAASVLGCMMLEKGVNIAGVVINRVAGSRHERIVRQSIEKYCGVPVLGAIPKIPRDQQIPLRHLGLITPKEESKISDLIRSLAHIADKYLDSARILEIAGSAPPLEETPSSSFSSSSFSASSSSERMHPETDTRNDSDIQDNLDIHDKDFQTRGEVTENGSGRIKICYLSDSAFSFYYPENLEALKEAGIKEGLSAKLVPVSALEADALPDCHALYIGGGFPETHAAALSENLSFRESVLAAAKAGLPIYAECGGLIYLAENLSWDGEDFPMTGVFPISMEMSKKPQGHGYTHMLVDNDNPFFEKGTELKGHEFHYSSPVRDAGSVRSVFEVRRGVGCGEHRDGLLRWNVLGTYLHIHALGCPSWAQGILKAAERYRKE